MTPYDTELKRSDELPQYSDELIIMLINMTRGYKFFLQEKAKLHYDEELFTECIADMLEILSHILPKLEGGGQRTKELYDKLKKFEPWINDVMIPKIKERTKVNELYNLIIRAYHVLGLTTL